MDLLLKYISSEEKLKKNIGVNSMRVMRSSGCDIFFPLICFSWIYNKPCSRGTRPSKEPVTFAAVVSFKMAFV